MPRRTAALLIVATTLFASSVKAETQPPPDTGAPIQPLMMAQNSATAGSAGTTATAPPAYTPQTQSVAIGAPPQQAAPARPVYKTWWFWTAVGVVGATVLLITLTSSSGPDQPKTDLGNMHAF